MVAQAYPFVVRKVLRNDSNGSMSLLQDILFDSDGKVRCMSPVFCILATRGGTQQRCLRSGMQIV